MTQPLPAPYFSAGYTTPLTDIGSGYAAGITSAGKSLAGAISSVMGSVNPQTGEVQSGILEQGQSAHDTIDIMHSMGLFDDDVYGKLKTSSLSAQQKAIGMYTSIATAKAQSQFEMNKALAVAKMQEDAAMARTRVSEAGAMARQQVAVAGKEQVAQEKQPQIVRVQPTQPTQPQQPNQSNINVPPTYKFGLGSGYQP